MRPSGRLIIILICALVLGIRASAAVGITPRDLQRQIVPQNPVKTWGKVTSTSPLRISDGAVEIEVTGLALLDTGDYLVVEGDWNGSVLVASQEPRKACAYKFPSRTELVYIPAGSFLMGNSGIGNDLYYDQQYNLYGEKPQHSVYLTGYWIGKYEVTRGEYRAFVNAGGYSDPAYWSSAGWSWKVSNSRTQPYYWAAQQDWWGDQPFTQTDNHPVVGVSYYEAEAFCNWAGGHLATEAQWEKAARWTGSHPNVYPWGDTWDAEKCNNFYDTNPAGGGYAGYQTAPVGSYLSGGSPYGCHDMAGNVWEWVQDWSKSYPGSSDPYDYTDSYRVLRGGSWCYGAYDSDYRAAHRSCSDPGSYWDYYGFRMVR